MINEALEFIRREVRDHLNVSDAEAQLESARVLAQEGTAEGLAITLINVEEEPALRNTPNTIIADGQPVTRKPSAFMNLYLLFAFDFPNYGMSLLNLSETIALFQDRRIFTAADGSVDNPFPERAAQLAFDHHNMSFEALNNLWSIMGGTLFPCVIYKVRLLEIRHEAEELPGPPIRTIAMDTSGT
ncbi:DUF4255 domain-containing protein [Tateyamaria sp. syn59]|uniref:DUF4255 domain-containing protein n=1 Tax=Tateyamaria sp. syn59 TaxID=2576942 RepID=UPI0011BF50ED|nr:DUF4255 domain-containing protein [Tateyamaria sp. syn59]